MSIESKDSILESRKDQVILLVKGRVKLVRDSPYIDLKYRVFKGERIKYAFIDNVSIEETYDDGIFNCRHYDKIIQSAERDRVALAIRQHMLYKSDREFASLFGLDHISKNRAGLVKNMFRGYGGRLTFLDDSGQIVIDGTYIVDSYGNAFVRNVENEQKIPTKYLCIVAADAELKEDYREELDTPDGKVILDNIDIMVLSKVYFLLNPNPDDDYFMRQLPEEIKNQVKEQSRSREGNG